MTATFEITYLRDHVDAREKATIEKIARLTVERALQYVDSGEFYVIRAGMNWQTRGRNDGSPNTYARVTVNR